MYPGILHYVWLHLLMKERLCAKQSVWLVGLLLNQAPSIIIVIIVVINVIIVIINIIIIMLLLLLPGTSETLQPH